MIQNISTSLQPQMRTNTPNFGKCMISEASKPLKFLEGTDIPVFTQREASDEETTKVLGTITGLLDKSLKWAAHTVFEKIGRGTEAHIVEIQSADGDILMLEKSEDTEFTIRHLVYEDNHKPTKNDTDNKVYYANDNLDRSVEITENEGLSVNNARLFKETVDKILDKVQGVPVDAIQDFPMRMYSD